MLLVLTLIAIALAGTSLFLWVTAPHGMYVGGDSVAYIWSARNLADGIGLGRLDGAGALRVLPDWPPLFPFSLSLFEMVGIDALAGARLLCSLLFGANLFLIGRVISRLTRSFLFPIMGVMVLALSYNLALTSFSIMTEPLYLFLSLLGIEIFNKYQRDGQPLRWLAWLGGVGALLFLTRFVGLALVAACALVILIQAGRPWLVRLRDAAALVGISVLPMLTWMLRNYLAAESLANKNMSFTAIPAEQIADLVDIFEQLSFPLERIFMIGAAKAALSAAILIALAIRAWSFKTETNPADRIAAKPTAAVLAIYTVTYPAIVLISKVFIDKNVSFFEHRFVAPFFISLVILFTAFFSIGWERVWRRMRAAGFVYGLLLTLVYGSYCSVFVQKSYPYLRSLYLNGGGYTETRYLESDFYNVLQSLPGDQVAFTDNIERLYLYTGKYSYAFYDQTPETLAQVRQRMNGKEGAFFVFFKHTAEWNENTLAEFPEMELFYKHADGSIFIQDRTH